VKPLSLIPAFLLATVAAAVAPTRPVPFQQVPPLVPAMPASPSDYTPAPVPDLDFDAPSGPRKTGPSQPELKPGLLHAPSMVYRGEGYTPGSTMTDEQARRFHPTPGLNLSLPLD
jgi:hypothetical protein